MSDLISYLSDKLSLINLFPATFFLCPAQEWAFVLFPDSTSVTLIFQTQLQTKQ